MTTPARLPTRQLIAPDVPRFDTSGLAPATRDALAELLLTLADDEFVAGFRDSEWTGIAPMLEEDVAFSSIAQDEIGHARVFYEMRAQLTGEEADRTAYGRQPHEYRHARLLDHPRNDWAYTITRRWLYDSADAVRLEALAGSSFVPLAEVVAKIRREERYHLLHLDTWLGRLAGHPGPPRDKVADALEIVLPDAASVFAPLPAEDRLLADAILAAPMADLAARWRTQANTRLNELDLRQIPDAAPPADGRRRDEAAVAEGFRSLWDEFTSVYRSEEGVEW